MPQLRGTCRPIYLHIRVAPAWHTTCLENLLPPYFCHRCEFQPHRADHGHRADTVTGDEGRAGRAGQAGQARAAVPGAFSPQAHAADLAGGREPGSAAAPRAEGKEPCRSAPRSSPPARSPDWPSRLTEVRGRQTSMRALGAWRAACSEHRVPSDAHRPRLKISDSGALPLSSRGHGSQTHTRTKHTSSRAHTHAQHWDTGHWTAMSSPPALVRAGPGCRNSERIPQSGDCTHDARLS